VNANGTMCGEEVIRIVRIVLEAVGALTVFPADRIPDRADDDAFAATGERWRPVERFRAREASEPRCFSHGSHSSRLGDICDRAQNMSGH
jgi:hypothetical protein